MGESGAWVLVPVEREVRKIFRDKREATVGIFPPTCDICDVQKAYKIQEAQGWTSILPSAQASAQLLI